MYSLINISFNFLRRFGWVLGTRWSWRRSRFEKSCCITQFTIFFRWVLSVFFKRTMYRGHECTTLFWWMYGTICARHCYVFWPESLFLECRMAVVLGTFNWSEQVGPCHSVNLNGSLPVIPFSRHQSFWRLHQGNCPYRFVWFCLYLPYALLTFYFIILFSRWL